MNFSKIQQNHWKQVKEIYMEAFPKRERKPFHSIYHSVQKGKAAIFTALEENTVLGFIMAIPYENMVMVDYLAVSSKIRSKGTGSFLIQEICRHFSGRKIVLLIERLDPCAENHEQRIARRKFYVKNGFSSSDIFIDGASGEMEILNYGSKVSPEEYLRLQQYALGRLFLRLSGKPIKENFPAF